MRPKMLKMKAFGPFLQETEVDFEQMGNDVYLISGDTGAGKTTIFDAIVYALYGVASGDARTKLDTESFHSDYAKKDGCREEMNVFFSFSNAGRDYQITRRMYWGKKGTAQKSVKESYLEDGAGHLIVASKGKEEKDEVTKKIEAIVGLNADQFRRIVMLAQGEFRKFLEADSKERGEILGKIFDNRKYENLEARLVAAKEYLNRKDKNLEDRIEMYLSDFVKPENLSEEEENGFHSHHPQLLEHLEENIEKLETEYKGIREVLYQHQKVLENLKNKKATAEEHNQQLERLQKENERKKELDEKKDLMEKIKKRIQEVEKALKLFPYEREFANAKKSLDETEKRLEEIQKKLEKEEPECKSLEEKSAQYEAEIRPEIEKLKLQIGELENKREKYDTFRMLQKNYQEMEKKMEEAEQEITAKSLSVDEKKKILSKLDKLQKELSDEGEAAASLAEERVKKCIEKKTALARLLEKIEFTEELIKKEKKCREKWLKKGKEVQEANEQYSKIHKDFIEGQAAFLAEDMREQLKTKKEVLCPVCHTIHKAEDSGNFAVFDSEIPTRKEVDAAFKIFTKKQKEEHELDNDCKSLGQKIEQNKAEVLEKAADFVEKPSFEEVLKKEIFHQVAEQIEKEYQAAEKTLEERKEKKQKKEEMLQKSEKTKNELEEAEEKLRCLKEEQSDRKTKKARFAAKMEETQEALLGCPKTKEEADVQIQKWKQARKSMEEELEKTATRLNQYRESITKSNAAQKAYTEQFKKEQIREKNAEAEWEKHLSEYGFETLQDYLRIITFQKVRRSEKELLGWCEKKTREVKEYEEKCRDNEIKRKELSELTKDYRYEDLTELESEIKDVNEKISQVDGQERTISAKLNQNKKVFGQMKLSVKEREKLLRVKDKIKPLADSAKNNQYQFSRYVLTGFFGRIVEQANYHLDTMTDGEYQLVLSDNGDGRRSQGLDIRVNNTITGICRDTASLSGGQSFEASLALALGLSDVVQMQSTSGIQIDSMFVDEGFGSLDENHLKKAISVLQNLADGKRQVGIISHVSVLEECLNKKIKVESGKNGSRVLIETDM